MTNLFVIMPRVRNKLTAEKRAIKNQEKLDRQSKYAWVVMNGKQVRVKKPATIDGVPQDEWLEKNADLIWLHQNEMWHVIDERELQEENGELF